MSNPNSAGASGSKSTGEEATIKEEDDKKVEDHIGDYTATTSLTLVPRPLKFLRPRYGTLKGYYEKMPDSELKKLLADILSVLPRTMSAEGERACLLFCVFDNYSLKYRLLGFQSDIGSWGHEYIR